MAGITDEQLILQTVYRREQARGDALFMTQPTGGGALDTFTWKRTLDEARRVAAYLRSLDLPPKSQIALVSKNCAHFIITDLAIWMAGHVSVALYPTLNADTVAYILEHSEAKLIFVGKLDIYPEIAKGIPEDMPRVTFPLAPKDATGKPWSEVLAEHEPIEDSPVRDADDMAIIIYTSGSTGQPKGVMHSFGAMSVASHSVNRTLSVTEEDRALSYLPLAHAFERWIVESNALIAGFQVFFAESLDTFVNDLNRAHPTIFISVPRLWLKFQLGVFKKMPPKKLNLFLKIPFLNNIVRKKILTGLGLDAVRFAGSGSAPIPGDLIQWYNDLGLELLEGYGMSENFSLSHMSMPGKARVGYVGNTHDEVECRISDAGEILVKSPATMLGYFKEPEMTAESFTEDGFLKTGDRGEIDSQGRLRITGRVKELFKTAKGKYVAPAPIENIINNDPRVELSCVFGNGYPSACAVVNLAEDYQARLDEPGVRDEIDAALAALLEKVNSEVESFEKLQFLAVAKTTWDIEEGFLTPTMKIKRGSIEDTYSPNLDAWYDSGKPVIWEE